MALKKFDQDLLTRIFRKIVKNYATQSEMDSANERIDNLVAEGGEPNVIETVKQNGTALPVSDKAVDVTVPTKVSELDNDADYATTSEIPTKTSELSNDSGYITSASIPTKTSDLTNDSGFITSASVPTKTSDLTNDSGYITSADVPTKLSELSDDVGYAKESDVNSEIDSLNNSLSQTNDEVTQLNSALDDSTTLSRYTLTLTFGDTTSNLYLRKYGRIVLAIISHVVTVNSANTFQSFGGTIPDEYLPEMQNVYPVIGRADAYIHGTGVIIVNTSGTIQISLSNTNQQNVCQTMAWISAS